MPRERDIPRTQQADTLAMPFEPPSSQYTLKDIQTRFQKEIDIMRRQNTSEDKRPALQLFFRYLVAKGLPKDKIAQAFHLKPEIVNTEVVTARTPERLPEWQRFMRAINIHLPERQAILDNEVRDLRLQRNPKLGNREIARIVGRGPRALQKSIQRLSVSGAIDQRLHPQVSRLPTNFSRVPFASLMREFDLSEITVRRHVAAVARKNESHFIRRGRANAHNADQEGLDLIKQDLQNLVCPEQQVKIDTSSLGTEFGITGGTVLQYIHQCAKQFPTEITIKGQGKPSHATPQGIIRLKEMLKNRPPKIWERKARGKRK